MASLLDERVLSFFPEVNDRVREGLLDRSDAMRAWDALSNEFSHVAQAVILHGSVLKGQAGPYSDIDILILVSEGTRPQHLLRCQAGYLIDLTVLPLSAVTEAAQRYGATRLSGEITGILEGETLVGDPELVQRARSRVREFANKSPESVARLCRGMEARTFGRLTDYCLANDNARKISIAVDIYTLCSAIAGLRELGQLLPTPLVMERISPPMAAILCRLQHSTRLAPSEMVEVVLDEFGLETFDRWENMFEG